MLDEHLDEALERAAELLHKLVPGRGAYEYLEGWAEAIRALEAEHDEPCLDCRDSLGCTTRDAIASFVKAMLGEVKNKRPLTSEPLMKGTLEEHNEGKHKVYQFASCTLCNPLLRIP